MTRWNRRLVVSLFCLATAAGACLAEEAKDLKPVLGQPGQLLFEDTFDSDALGAKWRVAKGDWTVRQGILVGKEKKEDKHAAVLSCNIPNRNSSIRFAFKLDGAKTFHLSFNKTRGHLFRVTVTKAGMQIRKDKDKKDPQSKSIALANAKHPFQQGKWYTLLVEVQDDQVIVQTDTGIKLQAKHPQLDVDKPNYRFVTSGEELCIDEVKIWKAAE